MKVLTGRKAPSNKFTDNMIKANIGCNVCPECGEHSSMHIDLITGKLRGIGTGLVSESFTRFGFPKMKHYRINKYQCYSCGCIWESDSYQYE